MKASYTRLVLTLEASRLLADGAIEKAREIGLAISVVVLDHAGRMKAFASMDEAPNVSLEASIKKAKTAMGFGLPTGESWYQFMKDDPMMMIGAQQLPDFILLGGASPLKTGGVIVGGIGVSGGHYSKDEECVRHALSLLGKADPSFAS